MKMSFSRKNNRLMVIVTDQNHINHIHLSPTERRKMINKKMNEYGISNYVVYKS